MGNCTDVVFFYRYPHEVIRSHAHVQGLGPFEGLFGLIGRIYKDGGGWRAFYRGVGTNLVRTTPAAARCLGVAPAQLNHAQHFRFASSNKQKTYFSNILFQRSYADPQEASKLAAQ